jgi:hypothetical protein
MGRQIRSGVLSAGYALINRFVIHFQNLVYLIWYCT